MVLKYTENLQKNLLISYSEDKCATKENRKCIILGLIYADNTENSLYVLRWVLKYYR